MLYPSEPSVHVSHVKTTQWNVYLLCLKWIFIGKRIILQSTDKLREPLVSHSCSGMQRQTAMHSTSSAVPEQFLPSAPVFCRLSRLTCISSWACKSGTRGNQASQNFKEKGFSLSFCRAYRAWPRTSLPVVWLLRRNNKQFVFYKHREKRVSKIDIYTHKKAPVLIKRSHGEINKSWQPWFLVVSLWSI